MRKNNDLLAIEFVSGNKFNCAYYGLIGPVVHVTADHFWVQDTDRCVRVPHWDLRYFRVYKRRKNLRSKE